jgi:hypothetical protein
LLAHFSNIMANEQQDLTKKRKGEQQKNYSLCHDRLCEKAHPLKAPGSVASSLRNSQIYRINDKMEGWSRPTVLFLPMPEFTTQSAHEPSTLREK